jgi:hypothetical protein
VSIRKSKLDRFSVVLISIALMLFIVSAVCYVIAVLIFFLPPAGDPLPTFSILDIANFTGIGGMVVVPLFIASAVFVNIREKRREKKTGKDLDDNPESGAAGRSRPDQQDT